MEKVEFAPGLHARSHAVMLDMEGGVILPSTYRSRRWKSHSPLALTNIGEDTIMSNQPHKHLTITLDNNIGFILHDMIGYSN
jgi:hypothetical protein